MYVSYFNKKDFAFIMHSLMIITAHCYQDHWLQQIQSLMDYGNNYKNVLNELEYFHVSYGQLPQYATQEKLSAFAYLGRFPR